MPRGNAAAKILLQNQTGQPAYHLRAVLFLYCILKILPHPKTICGLFRKSKKTEKIIVSPSFTIFPSSVILLYTGAQFLRKHIHHSRALHRIYCGISRYAPVRRLLRYFPSFPARSLRSRQTGGFSFYLLFFSSFLNLTLPHKRIPTKPTHSPPVHCMQRACRNNFSLLRS